MGKSPVVEFTLDKVPVDEGPVGRVCIGQSSCGQSF